MAIKQQPIWTPTPKQIEFLEAPDEEILYGGAAGGGKTDALVIDALGLWQSAPNNPKYRAIILRRTFAELREVIDRSIRIYPQIIRGAKYNTSDKAWTFPAGSKLLFGYANIVADVYQYQGQEFQYIGWEELTQWPTSACYDYLLTRLRGTGLKKLVRATCNPGGVGSAWVQERFAIDDDGSASKQDLTTVVDEETVRWRRRFIPARLSDNPNLGADYKAILLKMPEMERRALLDGRWDVQEVPGQIYRAELEDVVKTGRICSVPYDPTLLVTTFWDLGMKDPTSIWFVQQAGREVRVIDYYEANGEGMPHYANVLNQKGYVYKAHWAPHDIAVRELGSGRSRIETAESLGIKFQITPNIPVEDGIHAARMLFPRCWFDKEKTSVGREGLRSYRREYNHKMGAFKAEPYHDWASNPSDAFRYIAVALQDEREKREKKPARSASGSAGWMRG